MSYGRMECGAVPGYTDRPTGPITLYSISASGLVSRPLNRVERMAQTTKLEKEVAKLEDVMDRKIARAQQAIAKKYLTFFRRLIAAHNLRNHRVFISACMGKALIKIDNKYVSDYNRQFPVIDVLQEIDQMLGCQEWAYHLHNEEIN